jgi:hypothetical protein
MARGLTSAVNTELATDSLNPVTLVYLGVASGSRYTDHYKDVSYSSNTYTASSIFLDASAVTESAEVEISNIQLRFSGADQSIISLFLNNNYMNKDVEVYKGFLNDSQGLISDPFTLFKGKIESFSVDEEINRSTVTISATSHWSDFERVQGRRTNTNSQQIHFDADVGFDYASQAIAELKWGRS